MAEMEFVVVDDEDDSQSEFNYGESDKVNNGGGGRILFNKMGLNLNEADDEVLIASNSLNRRNVNSNRENEVQNPNSGVGPSNSGRTRSGRRPLQKFGSREHEQRDYGVGRPISGMTRRCACNLSQCASTNYMCKSERRAIRNEDGTQTELDSGCFVEELDPATLEALSKGGVGLTEANGKITSARRGCIEMLAKEKFKLCSEVPGAPVHCCFDEEMCNYPKTFYPPQIHNSHLNPNRLSFDSQNGAASSNLDQQVWLRAALLTIPIFGIIILIILIVFARRMLKNDAKDKEYRTAAAARGHHRRSHGHKGCANHHNSPVASNSPTFQANSSSCPLVRPSGSPTMPIAELHC